MTVIERSTDGFEIAEEDLKLRGPGDFYGTRQSGVELLPFMDVVRDVPVLHDAREEALALIAADPELRRPENIGLRALVAAKRRMLGPIAGTN